MFPIVLRWHVRYGMYTISSGAVQHLAVCLMDICNATNKGRVPIIVGVIAEVTTLLSDECLDLSHLSNWIPFIRTTFVV